MFFYFVCVNQICNDEVVPIFYKKVIILFYGTVVHGSAREGGGHAIPRSNGKTNTQGRVRDEGKEKKSMR